MENVEALKDRIVLLEKSVKELTMLLSVQKEIKIVHEYHYYYNQQPQIQLYTIQPTVPYYTTSNQYTVSRSNISNGPRAQACGGDVNG